LGHAIFLLAWSRAAVSLNLTDAPASGLPDGKRRGGVGAACVRDSIHHAICEGEGEVEVGLYMDFTIREDDLGVHGLELPRLLAST
jgi:hypothetical protein